MRHRKAKGKLAKPTDQRLAMLRGIAAGLIRDGKVVTSKDRAKQARKLVERIVALSKRGGLANLRKAVTLVHAKKAVAEFFKAAPERFASHKGGVTRITNVASRRGDNADMVLLELL